MTKSNSASGTRKYRGFTLLEVMIALALISIALIPLIKTPVAIVSNQHYLKSKTFAQWVALNKITEYRLQRNIPAIGKKIGSELMVGREWYWTVEVKKTDSKTIRRLEVSVREGEEKNDPKILEMIAFVGLPQ